MGIGMIFPGACERASPRNFRAGRPSSVKNPDPAQKTGPKARHDARSSALRTCTGASRATLRYGFHASAFHAERRDVSASSRRNRPRRLRRRVAGRMLARTERTLVFDRACS
jgi:hypothetical protein